MLALGVGGCGAAGKKEKAKKDETAAEKKKEPEKPALPEMGNDVAFQSFVGRLRTAVERRDRITLGSMMTPYFGWSFEQPENARWDQMPPGQTPFDYWDKHQLWGELASLLSQKFVSHEGYMVSPAEFAAASQYAGYRCGLSMVNGSWRFAYFVGGSDLPL